MHGLRAGYLGCTVSPKVLCEPSCARRNGDASTVTAVSGLYPAAVFIIAAAFLGEDGKPSSPIIVEGANLFVTPDARAPGRRPR